MGSTLYVFIDESGLPNKNEYVTLAGCWCISQNGPAPTLNQSRIKVLEILTSVNEIPDNEQEIKSKDISAGGCDTILNCIKQVTNKDNTIEHAPYPWSESGFPIRFTFASLDAGVTRDIFTEFSHKLDTPRMIQCVLLVDVLSPLLAPSALDQREYDDVRVMLDSEAWSKSKASIETVPGLSDFEYRCEDSKKAPGIQFADLAAGIRRRHQLRKDQFDSAITSLHNLSLE